MLDTLMRFSLIFILGVLTPSASFANYSCLSVFSTERVTSKTTTVDQVFASQELVGQDYALTKALIDAELPENLTLSSLSKKQKAKLTETVIEEVKGELPAIIDPQGRIFILDGHHDLYLLSQLGVPLSKIELKLRILKDFSETPISMAAFKKEIVFEQWVYGSVDKIIDQPQKVGALIDSTERSQMGLAFMMIQDVYGVPMKGKHFSPFIQFKIADLITAKSLFAFQKNYSKKDIKELVEVILFSRDVVTFLHANLKSEAPEKLNKFLTNLLLDLQ